MPCLRSENPLTHHLVPVEQVEVLQGTAHRVRSLKSECQGTFQDAAIPAMNTEVVAEGRKKPKCPFLGIAGFDMIDPRVQDRGLAMLSLADGAQVGRAEGLGKVRNPTKFRHPMRIRRRIKRKRFLVGPAHAGSLWMQGRMLKSATRCLPNRPPQGGGIRQTLGPHRSGDPPRIFAPLRSAGSPRAKSTDCPSRPRSHRDGQTPLPCECRPFENSGSGDDRGPGRRKFRLPRGSQDPFEVRRRQQFHGPLLLFEASTMVIAIPASVGIPKTFKTAKVLVQRRPRKFLGDLLRKQAVIKGALLAVNVVQINLLFEVPKLTAELGPAPAPIPPEVLALRLLLPLAILVLAVREVLRVRGGLALVISNASTGFDVANRPKEVFDRFRRRSAARGGRMIRFCQYHDSESEGWFFRLGGRFLEYTWRIVVRARSPLGDLWYGCCDSSDFYRISSLGCAAASRTCPQEPGLVGFSLHSPLTGRYPRTKIPRL